MEISIPQLVIDYSTWMGGCDKNDQLTRLDKTRRHYLWPMYSFKGLASQSQVITIFRYGCGIVFCTQIARDVGK